MGLPLFRTPSDPSIPSGKLQGRGREGKGRHRRVVEKGKVLDLMAEEFAGPQIVKKTDEALPEAIFLVVPVLPDSPEPKFPQFFRQNERICLDLFVNFDHPLLHIC
jgi:hypothetical protein